LSESIDINKLNISKSCEDIRDIARPLRQNLNIKHFGYVKIFSDGSHLTLGTNVDWHECFYSNFFQNGAYHKTLDAYVSGFHLWSQLSDQSTVQIMREQFDMDHGIALVDKTENHCEIFSFGTGKDNPNIVNWYLNNLDLLKMFAVFFKEKASSIIELSNKTDRLIFPKCSDTDSDNKILSTYEISNSSIKNFINEISKHKTTFTSWLILSLSQQEFICCSWASEGLTIKQIGKILEISPRTVETYLNNSKKKFSVKNLKQLICVFSREMHLNDAL
jgi:DNA-binding CsgD family transcriptional regulator